MAVLGAPVGILRRTDGDFRQGRNRKSDLGLCHALPHDREVREDKAGPLCLCDDLVVDLVDVFLAVNSHRLKAGLTDRGAMAFSYISVVSSMPLKKSLLT